MRARDVDIAAVHRAADALARRCEADPSMAHTSSLLVSVDGETVLQRGLGGQELDAPVPTIASITKSLLSTVVGAAVDDGLLRLDQRLEDLLGSRVPRHRRGPTIAHLLTMTSGAAGGVERIDEVMELPSGWVDVLLAEPQVAPPGQVFCYDNGAPHVLAAAVHQAVGGDLLRFARERVLEQCGCSDIEWPTDPEGVPYGFGDASLSPRALLRFGEAWRTGSATSPAFRAAAWTAHCPGGPPENRAYGYLWWVGSDAGVSTFLAAGWAGQAVLIAPELAMTVVATGDPARLHPGSRAVLGEMHTILAAAASCDS